jgi:hypothetical protein
MKSAISPQLPNPCLRIPTLTFQVLQKGEAPNQPTSQLQKVENPIY